ncbi:MAG: glycosyltransferase [Patescibacteria group bacterium]
MKIVAHTLVKNEENFIWFAINSVIDHVDEIMVWDHGGIDDTISTVESIRNPKIKFKKAEGNVAELRQKMLNETDSDWVFILDGDEIWHEEAIKNLQFTIYNCDPKIDVIVSPNYLLIGDMFHYQKETAGKYRIACREGHYNIRAIRKTSSLHVDGVYPNEAYMTGAGVKVQNLLKEKILFLEEKYLHASFLLRSCKDRKKLKYEIGEEFPLDFYYPEVFFKPRPDIIPIPWQSMSSNYKLRAKLETPFKKLKRKLI